MERLWHAMYATTQSRGHPDSRLVGAIGALDIALWDLKGKALGQPVWRLLGGFPSAAIPAYADGTDLRARNRGACPPPRRLPGPGVHPGQVPHAQQRPGGGALRGRRRASRRWRRYPAHGRRASRLGPVDRRRRGPRSARNTMSTGWRSRSSGTTRLQGWPSWPAPPPHLLVAGGEGERTLYAARDLVARGAVRVLQLDILVRWRLHGLAQIRCPRRSLPCQGRSARGQLPGAKRPLGRGGPQRIDRLYLPGLRAVSNLVAALSGAAGRARRLDHPQRPSGPSAWSWIPISSAATGARACPQRAGRPGIHVPLRSGGAIGGAGAVGPLAVRRLEWSRSTRKVCPAMCCTKKPSRHVLRQPRLP